MNAIIMKIVGCTFLIPSLLFAGDLTGKVTYKGKVSSPQVIQVSKDTRVCGNKKEVRTLVVDESGGIESVVVRILGIKLSTDYTGPQPVLSQKNCEFDPPVVVFPMGTPLAITSKDAVLHNVHTLREDGSTAFNLAVPFRGMRLRWKPDAPGILRVKCDAGHTWMSAWIVITQSHYFSVTDALGNFTIRGLPPGRYVVEAWHPTLGKQAQTTNIEAAGATVSFEFVGN